MTKKSRSILETIFVTGLIAGIFFGIYLKTGTDVNPESLIMQIGYMICDAFKNIDPKSSLDCKTYMLLGSILILILGIAEILGLIFRAGDWRVGAVVYVVGFVVGSVLVLATV